MTVVFDAIWIPLTISGLGALWWAWITFDPRTWSAGWFVVPFYLLVAVALPLLPTMAAWLLWFALT